MQLSNTRRVAPAEATTVTPKKVKKKTASTVLSFGDEEQASRTRQYQNS
jgi:hypothetical protein